MEPEATIGIDEFRERFILTPEVRANLTAGEQAMLRMRVTQGIISPIVQALGVEIKAGRGRPTSGRMGKALMERLQDSAMDTGIDPKYVDKSRGSVLGILWTLDESLPPDDFVFDGYAADSLAEEEITLP